MTEKSKAMFGYGNKATGIAHTNSQGDACRMSEVLPKNRVRFKTMQEFTGAIESGRFRPCEICAGEYIQPESTTP